VRFDKRSRKLRIKKKKGKGTLPSRFLLYLSVGVVVLAIFLLAIYSGHERQLRRVRYDKIREDLDTLSSALLAYSQAHGQYPTAEQGLQALVHPARVPDPSGDRLPQGYVDYVPRDPWGNAYRYEVVNPLGPFDLMCLGADGQPGGTGEAADIHWKH
jgi:general secretion pathway protein G